jgi:CheY-like chemotaxis protein
VTIPAPRHQPETAAIPVVILSNSSREDDDQQAQQRGAAGDYMKAKLSLRELSAQVDQLVQAAQAVRQSDEPQTPGGRVPQ